MPEGYNKPKWRLKPVFGLKQAGELGNLLKVKCLGCKRTRYFLPADLVKYYGDHEVDDVTFTCPRCGTNRRVVLSLYKPQLGDYGSLEVRRPTEPQTIIKWRTVKLGDDAR